MSDEQAIEAEIQEKGKTAPRITPEHIDAQILCVSYVEGNKLGSITLPQVIEALSCLTICVLVLKNGFVIVGKSACASPENFDAELGRKIAMADARQQIWALEGYLLRTRLTA